MNFRDGLLRLSTVLVLMLFLGGCSTSQKTQPNNNDDSPEALKRQILELQKSQSAQAAKIDELNNKILILKEQVSGSPLPEAPPIEAKVNPLVPVAALPKEENINKATLTPVEKLYHQTIIDSKNQQLESVRQDVAQMLKQFRTSPLTNNAMFLYAETLYERGNYPKSAEEFEKLYKLFPDGNKAVSALYKLAMSYQKMGHPTEAQEAFENIVTVYPGSREALDAEKQIMNKSDQ